MIHGSFHAMGTEVEVWASDEARFRETVEWFDEVELRCSRFLPDSELSRLNRDPRSYIPVSPLLGDVLARAHELRDATDGIADPGTGAAVISWGYDRTFEDLPGLDSAPVGVEVAKDWSIDGQMVHRRPGVLLDLGGMGKGWTADVAIERGLALVVSAGGDIRSADVDTTVPIADPWGSIVATVDLGVGALATSSSTRRRWRVGTGEAHHLIDPRTGRPANTPVLSATVVANTAAEAEAGAKTVLILGEEGLAWADRQEWVSSALVIWHDGSAYATSGMELAA